MHTIHELAQGMSLRAICCGNGLAHITAVRKYVRDGAAVHQRHGHKPMKLDPFKPDQSWVQQDHLLNCVTMLEQFAPTGLYRWGEPTQETFVSRCGRETSAFPSAATKRRQASSCNLTGANFGTTKGVAAIIRCLASQRS